MVLVPQCCIILKRVSQKGRDGEDISWCRTSGPTYPAPKDHLLFMHSGAYLIYLHDFACVHALRWRGWSTPFRDICNNFNIIQLWSWWIVATDEHPETPRTCFDHLGSLAWHFGQVKKEPGRALRRVSRAHQRSDPELSNMAGSCFIFSLEKVFGKHLENTVSLESWIFVVSRSLGVGWCHKICLKYSISKEQRPLFMQFKPDQCHAAP